MIRNDNNLGYGKELKEQKNYKWKTYWVKNIAPNPYLTNEKRPYPPFYRPTHPFLQENLDPPSIIFKKSQAPIHKREGGSHYAMLLGIQC